MASTETGAAAPTPDEAAPVASEAYPPETWFRRQRYAVTDAGYKTPCWLWLLACNERGYGRAGWMADSSLRYALAHRIYYERVIGAVPDGLDLDHLCRNRACVNPAHLEPVTRLENLTRGIRGRRLTKESVLAIRSSAERGIDLARRYGVSTTTISDVRTGKTWKVLHER